MKRLKMAVVGSEDYPGGASRGCGQFVFGKGDGSRKTFGSIYFKLTHFLNKDKFVNLNGKKCYKVNTAEFHTKSNP